MRRLAIVTTHPIQYYAPWFRFIAAQGGIELKVFYLWNRGAEAKHDPGFGRAVEWDVPLLEGYEYEFVPNTSRDPGSHSFWGIRNEKLRSRIQEFKPDAALLIGYRYASMMRLIFTPSKRRGFPLLFRGDSHRLAEAKAETLTADMRKSAIRNPTSAFRARAISDVYRRFAAFLYVGQANREYFRMHGVPDEKLFFAPHAIDNERFSGDREAANTSAREWRRELGIPEGDAVVLFAGKLEGKKRPLDLLEAFGQLGLPDVSLLVVGNGHLESELRSRAGGMSKVYFAPFQNQSQMPRTYAACDLFVLPSYGSEESWGLAVNEALCLRKAVIVSDHVGCGPDLVHSGVNGLIFRAGEVSALTSALRDALSDRARLGRWGDAGYEIVTAYDYAHATRGLEEGLEKLEVRS